MKIYTIWRNINSFEDAWLINAWDEYSIDGNNEGWQEALKEASNSNKEDIKVIVVNVDNKELEKLFSTPEVSGKVENPVD